MLMMGTMIGRGYGMVSMKWTARIGAPSALVVRVGWERMARDGDAGVEC